VRTAQQRSMQAAQSILAACGQEDEAVAAIQLRPRWFLLQGAAALLLGYALPVSLGLPAVLFLSVGVVLALCVFAWREYSTLLVELSSGR
jgi:hypothetical protein